MTAHAQTLNTRQVIVDSIAPQSLTVAALASSGTFLISAVLGWPVWAITIATVAPWLPVAVTQTHWVARRFGWLALFYALVVTQSAHFGEHVAQMIEIHLLGLSGPNAMGLISPLNMEWIHMLWNGLAFAGVLLLLYWFRDNRWLWVSLVAATWHVIEHIYIMSVYLDTGVEGTPGLLAQSGAIGGGLPLTRADLHFLYNLAMTAPILIAFAVQMRHTGGWSTRAGMQP